MLAYYCWVNRDWTPSYFDSLSYREKLLIAEFAKKEAAGRDNIINGKYK